MTAPRIGAVKTNPLSLEQAKKLRNGDEIYSYYDHYAPRSKSAPLEPHRIKITSVKVWKTRPNEVLLGCKYGFFNRSGCFRVSELFLDDYTTSYEDAKNYLNEIKHPK